MQKLKKQKYPKIHRMEQRSNEWFEARKGKMTSSNSATIASNGKGLETYIYEILASKYSRNDEEKYLSIDMQRGIDLEDQARNVYDIEYETVEQVGLIDYNEYFSSSPDGLVGKDGGIEIKCPNSSNFFRLLVNGKDAIDKKYLWQMQGQMLAANRKWVDFVAYNVGFDKSLVVIRIEKNPAMQEKLIAGINKGTEMIKALEKRYEKMFKV